MSGKVERPSWNMKLIEGGDIVCVAFGACPYCMVSFAPSTSLPSLPTSQLRRGKIFILTGFLSHCRSDCVCCYNMETLGHA